MTQEIEKNIAELNLLGARLQEMEQQLQIIDKQISELQLTSLALQELENTEKDTEMLAQIGQNTFVRSKVIDNKKVMINLGSKIFAEKSLEEAQEILDKKTEEFVNIREQIAGQAQLLLNAMDNVENKIKK